MIHRLCKAEDIADDSWKTFTLNNFVEIMVGFRHGKLFAINNTCPHRGAPLSKGSFNGENIVCHRHFYEYNLFTGNLEKIASWKKDDAWIEQNPAWRSSDDLMVYHAFVQDGSIYVETN